MFLTKLKSAAVGVLTLAFVTTGSWGLLRTTANARAAQPPADENVVPDAPARADPPVDDTPAWQEVAVLRGPKGGVWCVAFSPDGKTLASGSSGEGAGREGELRIWDLATGKLMAVSTTARPVRSLAFSPDGRLLAVAAETKAAMLFEVPTGKMLVATDLAGGGIHAVALSPDGKLLATGNADRTVRLWDVSEKPALAAGAKLAGHAGVVRGVAFSPDGRQLLSAAEDGTARVWDAATGKQIRQLASPKGELETAIYSPDGKLVATGGSDHRVRLWDASTGKEVRVQQIADGGAPAIAFSPDGRRIAVGDHTAGAVVLWDVKTGQILANLRGHSAPVVCVAFSPDGKMLASGSSDGTVRLWRQVTTRPRAAAARPDGLVADRLDQLLNQLVQGNRTDEQVVEALYLATLGRLPTEGEKGRFAKLQRTKPSARQEAFEELLAALAASKEFQVHVEALRQRTTLPGGH